MLTLDLTGCSTCEASVRDFFTLGVLGEVEGDSGTSIGCVPAAVDLRLRLIFSGLTLSDMVVERLSE